MRLARIPYPSAGYVATYGALRRPRSDPRLVARAVARRKAESGEVIPIIPWAVRAIISPCPYRTLCRQKAISRGRGKGKSLPRDGSTEHKIEEDNPKHSPSPKRKDLKEQLKGTPKYYAHDNLGCAGSLSVEVVLCTPAGIERLLRHTRRSLLKQPSVASFPLLCFLPSALFLLVSVFFLCLQISLLTE
jgi:hypothetical protein